MHVRIGSTWFAVLFGLLWALVSCAHYEPIEPVPASSVPSGDPRFIPPGSRLELVVRGDDFGIVFTEGVAVGCDGNVYFSDITFTHRKASRTVRGTVLAGVIWVYNPKTEVTRVFRSPSGMSNGIKFDADCHMVTAEGADFGGRRITRTDMRTGVAEIVAALYEGQPFNSPNDLTIDAQGRIYFSDPRFVGHEPVQLDVMAVYRIDPDGSVERVISDVRKPNGVAIAPDQKTLYVVERGKARPDGDAYDPEISDRPEPSMRLLAYDLQPDGRASLREVLVDYGTQYGADGLVVDMEGNLWVAVQDKTRLGIYAYSPDGQEKAYIPTPRPTNVGFGRGGNAHVLYITAANNLYRITVGKRGYHLPPSLIVAMARHVVRLNGSRGPS